MLALLLALGCSAEEEPVVVARPAPVAAPPPPAPTVTPVSELMAQHRIDERIVLPEDKAPDNTEDRLAILEFFDAFARGDQKSVGEMMSGADRIELEDLVASGRWQQATKDIERIELQTGTSEYGPCVLAVITVDLDFQPQLWYYRGDSSGYTFEAAPSPPGILNLLSGTDWIASWHKILKEEMELANKPDEEFDVPQVNLDSGQTTSSGSASPGGGRPGPTGAPPNRGRRPPSGTPPRPPGIR